MMFAVTLNVGLSLIFMRSLKIGGLALASSISATVNVFALYYFLRKKTGPLDEQKILASFFRILASSAAMGVSAAVYAMFFLKENAVASRWLTLARSFGIILSVLIYFFASRLSALRSREFIQIIRKEEPKPVKFHGTPDPILPQRANSRASRTARCLFFQEQEGSPSTLESALDSQACPGHFRYFGEGFSKEGVMLGMWRVLIH